jgi:hypothetical protein
MQAQPTPQERSEALHRIHLHFTQAIPSFISGVLSPSMVDTLVFISKIAGTFSAHRSFKEA